MQNRDNLNGCNVTAVNGMSTHRRQTPSRALVFGSSERLPGGTDGTVHQASSRCCSYWQGSYVVPSVSGRVLTKQACRVRQCSHRPQLKLHHAIECLHAKVQYTGYWYFTPIVWENWATKWLSSENAETQTDRCCGVGGMNDVRHDKPTEMLCTQRHQYDDTHC